MVRLADIPAVVELRGACAALRPLVRAFDDAVSADVVDPPAERAAEATSSSAVARYQQAIVLANADAAVAENHNISDGLRAEAQLAATDYALDVILHQRAKLKFKGRQNQQRSMGSILEASVGAVTPVTEKLTAKDHLITSPVSDSRPTRARMESSLLTNECNSTPDPHKEYQLRDADLIEPAPCRRLEMTFDKGESEEDLTDEEPVNVVQTDDIHVEETELPLNSLPAEDHSSKVDTFPPTCGITNGLSENHREVDRQDTTGAKSFNESTPSERQDNLRTGLHDASKLASVKGTETLESGTVTNGVRASSTMQGTVKIDASSGYRCTSVFFMLTAALAVLAVLLEVSMSSYRGQTSTVLPVSRNPSAGPMSFHASWEAISSLFWAKRPNQVLVEDHTDVSDMDLKTMHAPSQAAGRDGDDL